LPATVSSDVDVVQAREIRNQKNEFTYASHEHSHLSAKSKSYSVKRGGGEEAGDRDRVVLHYF
jgi:hypothetical protein